MKPQPKLKCGVLWEVCVRGWGAEGCLKSLRVACPECCLPHHWAGDKPNPTAHFVQLSPGSAGPSAKSQVGLALQSIKPHKHSSVQLMSTCFKYTINEMAGIPPLGSWCLPTGGHVPREFATCALKGCIWCPGVHCRQAGRHHLWGGVAPPEN